MTRPTEPLEASLRPEAGRRSVRGQALTIALICAGFFCALAPFLRLFEFSNGGENAVVASVQEIHRGGPWLVPTLHEEQRTKKPPLATWLSALSAGRGTVARFSEPDPAARYKAYQDFAFQVRWPALAAMCGMLGATFVLATSIGGTRLGLFSSIVCGTTVFWLQSARLATTDAHLALWVTVANCLLAWAIFGGRPWPALVGAGAALGLAMMSKGPVALVQCVAPVLVYLLWRRFRSTAPEAGPNSEMGLPDTPGRPAGARASARLRWVAPLVVGLLLFAVIGLAWYAMVWWNNPSIWAEWKTELTREGATGLEPSKWYNYAGLPLVLFPWTLFFVIGLIGSVATAVAGASAEDRERRGRIVLALCLVLVPIVIMSFFRDRKMRYLVPLLGPASIVTAWGILELLGTTARRRGADLTVAAFQWLPLAVGTIGLGLTASPIGGALPEAWVQSLKTADGKPWYSLTSGLAIAVVSALMIVAALVVQRRARLWAVVGGGAVAMLFWNTAFNLGYRHSSEGSSELRPLAEKILATHPNAAVYSYRADRPTRHAPIDLSIYLNRVVETVSDPAAMKATSGPRVFLVRRKQSNLPPDPMSLAPQAGGPWQFFAATPVDDAMWYAFTPTP